MTLARADDGQSIGTLDKIQADTILLNARIKQQEARDTLAKQNGNSDGGLPVVKSIFGTQKRTVATFLYPGNMTIEAVQGDTLPGGYRVRKIYTETNKVDLTKDGQKFSVGMSSVAPIGGSGNAGLPGQLNVPVTPLPFTRTAP
jgi:hypothetical protein